MCSNRKGHGVQLNILSGYALPGLYCIKESSFSLVLRNGESNSWIDELVSVSYT